MTEDEMVGWHHCLNGHESAKTPGDSERQKNLVCCSPWGRRVRHGLTMVSQQLTNTRNKFTQGDEIPVH